MRRYLEDYWGFAAGRQDAILLLAITHQPNSRFSCDSEAKSFLDRLVKTYAVAAGLDLSSRKKDGGQSNPSVNVTMDPAVLNQLQEDQRRFDRKMLDLYAKKLNVDLDLKSTSASDSYNAVQTELDILSKELGEAYTEGIKPKFSSLKARVYDSYWNWAQQDLLTLVYDVANNGLQLTQDELIDQTHRLTNKSSPRLLKSMQYLAGKFSKSSDDRHSAAKEIVEFLIETQDIFEFASRCPK